MAIFDKDETEKSDYEKINVHTIEPYVQNGKWFFHHNGTAYPFAPAVATNASLSPVVVGADRIIQIGADLKKIKNCQEGIVLMFSEEYFPGADAKFTLLEGQFDGHVYDVESLNLEGIPANQKAWVCPYLGLYFDEPPKTIYLKLEEQQ